MAGDGLGTAKHEIKPFGAELVALDVRLVPDLKFPGCLGSAVFVAKENYFGLRVQQRPAFQRIALNDSVVAAEGFPVVKNVSISCFSSALLHARIFYFNCCRCDAIISSRIVSNPRVISQLG